MRIGLIIALLLLLAMGACLLFVLPRQARTASDRGALMTRFMEQDYVCCDLGYASRNPRCENVLRDVLALSKGEAGPGFARSAANALARCAAVDFVDLAGDAAALHQPLPVLAVRLQSNDPAVSRRAARLLFSDDTFAHEVQQGVLHGRGPLCWGAGLAPTPVGAVRPDCPGAAKLVETVGAILHDDRESESNRQKAAAMLTELGESAAAPGREKAAVSR